MRGPATSIAGPLFFRPDVPANSERLFKNQRGLDLVVALAKVEPMSVFASDLRPYAQQRDGFAARPLLDRLAKTFADTKIACVIADNEAPNDGTRGGLEMALDGGIDPTYDLTFENCSKGDAVG
jgi:hypothetical protein